MILIIVAVIVLLAGIMIGIGIAYVNHLVKTPEFKQMVLKAARDAVGADVKIEQIDVSVFSGVELKGVAISNPEGFAGQLLTANAFVLRYRLLPLLTRRLEIQQLTLQKPVITLSRNEKSEWNYERLGGKTTSTQPVEPTGTQRVGPAKSAKVHRANVDISFSHVNLADGEVVMLGEKNKALCRFQNIDIATSVDYARGQLRGAGKAGIQTLAVADSLFLRRITAPVAITPGEIKLAPLTGKVANGDATGDLSLQLTGTAQYRLNLQIANADVDVMQQEAGVTHHAINGGKLRGNAAITGTGGLPTIVGGGKLEIIGGKLAQLPLQELIATLLQVPELREVAFDQCVMEFSISNNVMFTPVIRLTSSQVQISGNGQVALDDYSLNHTLTLALAKGMLDRMPKEIRANFIERPDGFLAIEFRVWGPYASPKTDLQQRVLKGAAEQLLQKGLEKFLK
jgi:hypothetical protein